MPLLAGGGGIGGSSRSIWAAAAHRDETSAGLPPAPSAGVQTRARTSEALWPPNPKLLLIATSTFASRATLGT